MSIDVQGSRATVRVQRRDVITVNGDTQTTDSQQRITLQKGAAGWIIAELGE